MSVNQKQNSAFLEKLTEITENNMSNSLFGVEELANKIGMSRSNIHRYLKKITNQSASEFIKTARLKKAKKTD